MTENYDSFIANLYRSAASDKPWEDALDDIRLMFDLRWCALLLRRPDARHSFVSRISADESVDLRRGSSLIHSKYQTLRVLPIEFLQTGESLDTTNFPEYRQTEYYKETIGVANVVQEIIIRLNEDTTPDAWLFLGRGSETGPLDDVDLDDLSRLSPHFVQAMSFFSNLQFHKSQISVMESSLAQLGKAVVILNARKEILASNDEARRVLELHETFVLQGSRFTFRNAQFNDEFSKWSEIFTATRERHAPSLNTSEKLFAINCPCGADISVLLRPAPVLAWYWGDDTPCLVLYLSERNSRRKVSQNSLCELYGLTATEAKLTQHIIAGETLAESATMMGISLGTSRNHLKRVFLKVGVNRQSDLIIAISESVLPLCRS